MRGAQGAEKRGACGGVGSEEQISPPQLGWGLGRGCAPTQEIFVKFTLNFIHFAEVCEDYDSLKLTKFTKLK